MMTGLGGEPLLILAAWERGVGEQAKGGSGDKQNPSESHAPHRPLSFNSLSHLLAARPSPLIITLSKVLSTDEDRVFCLLVHLICVWVHLYCYS